MKFKEKIYFYLPYDVMFIDTRTSVDFDVKQLQTLNEDTICDVTQDCQLILNPIEIVNDVPHDFDGEQGVLSDRYFGFTNFKYYYNQYKKYGPAYWHNHAPFCVTKWLLEKHVDCFGMIEDGLAIPNISSKRN